MTAMKPKIRAGAAALLLLGLPVLAACDDQQAAERTGEEIGRAVDQTAERIGDAVGKVTEGAGEMLQDAGRSIEEGARDAARGDGQPEQPRPNP